MRLRSIILRAGGVAVLIGSAVPLPSLAATPALQRNQIRVTGVVPDRKYIVVDTKGSIRQIFSNSDKSVIPVVAVGAINGPVIALTPTLNAQFNALMAQIGANHVVSVQANDVPLTIDYPDFTHPTQARTFTVTPTKWRLDQIAAPYQITLADR